MSPTHGDDPAASEPGAHPSRSDSLPFGARRRPDASANASEGPRQFGPYRLQRELGRGASGVVYLARKVDDPRPVALKILLGEGDDAEGVARFELEAQIASKLWHPGIVPVLAAGQVGRHRYCALEYCEGVTLRQRLAEGPLTPRTAARLVAKLARAADHAHAHGVLHRDIKPANVLLQAADGEPRITDFGLAQDHSLRRSLTRTGDVLGTPAYMAPEQILGRRDVDRRADVYALGVTLYHCLTGTLPYSADTIPELVQVVLRGGATPPAERVPGLPGPLSAVCMRAMASERDARFATALELADALEAALTSPVTEPAPRSRQALLPALAVVAGLSLGLGVYALASRSVPTPEPPVRRPTPTVPEPPAVVPRALAPDAELKVLGALLTDSYRLVDAHALPDVWAEVGPRLDALLAAYPEDPRLPVFAVYREVVGRRATARDLGHAARTLGPDDPSLPPTFVGIVARIVAASGFQRAGRDWIEAATERGLEHPWAGLSLMHLRAVTAPPVRDVARACDAAAATLQALEREGRLNDPSANPPGWDVYANLALYRLHLDQTEAALDAAERAVSVAEGSQARGLAQLGEAIRRGRITPDTALDKVNGLFGVDALARAITPPRREVSDSEPAREAQRLQALLPSFASDPPAAALLEACAARAYARAGDPEAALRLLERARERVVEGDPDVRQLVERDLARTLLALERDPARALELARPTTTAPGLTRGERTDAWLLVARAQRALGQPADAAIAAAEALQPYDRRELDALR